MTPKTHDYTRRGYGHDFTCRPIDPQGTILALTGWGNGISAGDFMILPNDGGTTRYRISKISYYSNPSDMWSAEAVFSPRPKEASQGLT